MSALKHPLDGAIKAAEQRIAAEGYDNADEQTRWLTGLGYMRYAIREGVNGGSRTRKEAIAKSAPAVGGGTGLGAILMVVIERLL